MSPRTPRNLVLATTAAAASPAIAQSRLSQPAASPAPLTVRERIVCFVLAGALETLMKWRGVGDVLGGGYSDPDSTMRLARLTDTLRLGVPVDVVARDQSGAGFVLHWSHLFDMLLLLLAQPFRLIFLGSGPEAPDAPLSAAIHWAAVASGPLSVAALALALLWAIAPFADRSWRWFVAPALAISFPVSNYGVPGLVHHHILLAVVIAMQAGWAVRVGTAGALAGWEIGLWAGVGVWLSPETMPLTLLAIGGVGVQWLLRPGWPPPRRALLAIGPGFLLVLALALAVDPGAGDDWRHALDRISLLFVALALAVTVIGLGCLALDRAGARPMPRAAGAVVISAIVLGAWIAAYPQVLGGTEGVVTAPEARPYFAQIQEMLPVQSIGDGLRALTGGVFAFVLFAWLAWRRRSLEIGYVAAAALALLAMAAWHRRFATYDGVLGAAALAIALSLITSSRIGAHLGGAGARIGCIVLVLLVPVLPDLHSFAVTGQMKDSAAPPGKECPVRDIAKLLAPYAGQVVLANVNDSPELLYRTKVKTVGSLYLRAAPGMARLARAWRGPGNTPEEPPEVRATGATLVLACPGGLGKEPADAADANTLAERLDHNDPPPWLTRIGVDAAGHVLYRVRGE